MELRHLRYFIAVAERLNFSRAAEDLGTAQPSLSQQIRQLEREVGVTLFDRKRRKIDLTPAGVDFFGEARAIVQRVDDAVARARETARGLRGELRIAYTVSAMMADLPGAIRAYRAARPGVRLRLQAMGTTAVIDALRAREADAGVFVARGGAPRFDGLAARRIGSMPMAAVLPTNHRLAARRSIRLASLGSETLLTYARELTEIHDAVLELGRERGYTPGRIEEVDRTETLLGLVAAGEGVSIVPRVYEAIRFAGVVFVSVTPAPKPLAIMAASSAGARSRLAADFVGVFGKTGE